MWTMRGARFACSAAVLVGVGALAGCTGGHGGTTATSSAVVQGQAQAQRVLDQSGTKLTGAVNALAAVAAPSAFAPGAKLPSCQDDGATPTPSSTTAATVAGRSLLACFGFSGHAPCSVGAGNQSWPRRWGYSVNIRVPGTKGAAPTAQGLLNTLTSTNWKTRVNNPNPNSNLSKVTVIDITATREDETLHLVADDIPGVINIEAYGPCVGVSA